MKKKTFLLFALLLVFCFSLVDQGWSMGESKSPALIPSAFVMINDDIFWGSDPEFNVKEFLYGQPGLLKSYEEENQDLLVPAVDAIDFYSEFYGINPKLILTLMEVKSQALSNPNLSVEEIKFIFGELGGSSFFSQLKWSLDTLTQYYDELEVGNPSLVVDFGSGNKINLPAEIDPAGYALLKFLSLIMDYGAWQELVSTSENSFMAVYTSYFEVVESSADTRDASRALSGLRLPWGNNETWYFTGGPHYGSAGGVRYAKAAIDFAPGGGSGCFNSGAWVRAAKAGKVVYANCNFVRIDHGGGWSTGYFHLSSIQVSVGQTIAAGTALGHPSCGTGASCGWVGRATGSHVHFDTRIDNRPQRIAGTNLDGWVVANGSADYRGTLTLGSTVKTASVYKTSNNAIKASANDTDPDDGRTLSSGQILSGTRSPGTDVDVYYINGTAGQLLTIDMWKTSSSSLDTYLYLKDPGGRIVRVDDDGGDGFNSRIRGTLSATGRYQIHAKGFSTSTGAYQIKATLENVSSDSEDNRWLNHNHTLTGTLNTNNDKDVYYFSGVEGRIISLKMWKDNSNVDTYLELYNPSGVKIATNDDGLGNRDSWLVAVLPRNGVYRVVARSYNFASRGAYQIRLRSIDANNYAIGKTAIASSYETGSYTPRNGIDGNENTRWSSKFRDYQWFYVDLGTTRTVDMVKLTWERAYASRYGIFTWNGSRWENVYYTSHGNGGIDIIKFSPRNTRYVLVQGYERATVWGISFWEFGVYNSAYATQPIVNPEDPEKAPDIIDLEPPPTATSPEKDADLLLAMTAGMEGDQEFAPEPTAFSDDEPTITLDNNGNPVTSIEAIHFDDTLDPDALMLIEFYGLASDSDLEGEGEQITAHEWQSDIDGLLSTDEYFSRMSIDLSEGTHIISYRAKDNEGLWSEAATMELVIEHPAFFMKIFTPLIMK